MDNISTQTIPIQQISPESIAPIPSVPPLNPPQKTAFRKVFNISSWIILFALLPITVLIFLSQDSIPGDFFYPVKRGMEGVVLAAASVNPATKAAFQTDLTEKRFKEAQTLVLSKSNAEGLTTFVQDVEAVGLEISALSNEKEKAKAEEKLIDKLEEYQNNLTALEIKTKQNIIAYQPLEAATPTSIPSSTPTPLLQPTVSVPTPTTIQISPTSLPSSQPSKDQISLTPTPIPSLALTATPTLVPTLAIPTPTAHPETSEIIDEQEKIVEEIKKTKEKLDKIKKGLEEEKESNNRNRGREEGRERGKVRP